MKNTDCNSYYMGLIQNLYAGPNGCIYAFLQFFYQHQQCKNKFVGFEYCFENLYEKELENCEILCEILLKMGGDPQFFSSSKKYMSGRGVNYVKDKDSIFLTDIEFLEANLVDLKSMIYRIEDVNIKIGLRKILENKKNSLKTLKEIYFKNNLLK